MINILYIDPSIMTYTIQAITGIVIASCTGLGIFIKKISKKKKSKKKKTESDDIYIK